MTGNEIFYLIIGLVIGVNVTMGLMWESIRLHRERQVPSTKSDPVCKESELSQDCHSCDGGSNSERNGAD
jgi:hypothetical protein